MVNSKNDTATFYPGKSGGKSSYNQFTEFMSDRKRQPTVKSTLCITVRENKYIISQAISLSSRETTNE